MSLRLLAALLALGLAACPAEPSPSADAAVEIPDAALEAPDASTPDAGSKAAACATTFGSELTAAFGRLDGTVLAVVGPTDSQCTKPNSDHLVVQVLMHGAAYRIVINILSDGRNGTDTKLRYAEIRHALVGDPWSEGWHAPAALDYATSLDAHSTAGFTPYEMVDLVRAVSDRLVLGAKVSAYATSSGGAFADSAHLVHRNGYSRDGALVVDPDSASPLFLLFHFDGQTF